MPTNTQLKTYDPAEVIIILGTITWEGFADGEFATLEEDEDAYSMQVGTDGEAARSKSNNRGATFTGTLLHTSLTNSLLSALHNLDRNSTSGVGVVPFMIKDGSGSALHTAETAWIQRAPSRGYGREAGPREWVIRMNNLVSFDGGTPAV